MKALVIGATGATGKELVKILLKDSDFEEVHVFVRRTIQDNHPKLHTHVVDFDIPSEWKHLVKGDVAFSCLGTTLKDAGSKEAQRKVDFNYQYEFAKTARENGVETFALVSSYGSNVKSPIFYSKMKGQLEDEIKKLPFKQTLIFQPGMLDRPETNRTGEVIGLKVLKAVTNLGLFKSQRPLPTKTLASAMINLAKKKDTGLKIIQLTDIFDVAES